MTGLASAGGGPAAPLATVGRAGRGRAARLALLATTFLCAACGLVYQLALVTLGSYLVGDTATQASVVIASMMFAMGIGALVAKPLQRRAVVSFAVVEIALGLAGGLSVLVLYAAFAWLHLYSVAVVVVALLLGVLIGAEIPLLMVLLQRIRAQAAGGAVADLNAADYVGALLGGLAFPFLLLPVFGQLRGVLLVGALNAVAGIGLVCIVFRGQLSRRGRWGLLSATLAVGVLLAGCYAYADRFVATAQQQLYSSPIIYSEQTPYQRIVLTQSVSPFTGPDLRLFLNGDLQFSSVDEYRYHEALVHPAMAGPRAHVLVLGGGDGLALREILAYPDVESVTLVELDPAMIRLATTHPRLVALNEGALADGRVRVVNDDAFTWLRSVAHTYDVIIADLPDPDSTPLAKLYSVEFYAMAAARLTDRGRIAVQSGSPYFAPRSFWCVNRTLAAAGLHPVPYHVPVPSFGDWGFHLAAKEAEPPLRIDPPAPPRFLDQPTLGAATVFPADQREREVEVSTVLDPVIMRYTLSEWRGGG